MSATRLLSHTNASNKAIMRSVFRSHHEGDDIVDKEGLRSVLKEISSRVQEEINTSDKSIKSLMLLMDSDNNGTVDFEEFFKWWSKLIKNDVKKVGGVVDEISTLYENYISYDKDGKGYLNHDQFKMLWEDMGNDPCFAAEAINYVDANHDNQISFQELCIAFNII
ncbi:calmodulin [Acrasis kona]|uniref:Calmodulin n=1 Tax=Acrasis kona TaxID=1008807 RepID=A0AAW2ZKB3_9EUKA